MKITQVNIQGMHKVHNTTYDLSDCNYLCGKNGFGKSTVLQAIQLAILGYIPGYPKRNQDIVKHANSKIMSVKVTFDTDDYIERTYITTNSKVTSDLNTTIEDIDSITKDIEIPIYNFSSFLSLSPNEQKKWFLGFLPKEYDSKFNWKEMFDKEVSMLPEYNEDYIIELSDEITSRRCKSIELVCEYIKSVISFAKAQIKAKQSVLSDLMFYEDTDEYDLDSVTNELNEKEAQYLDFTKQIEVIIEIKQRKTIMDSCKQFTKETFDEESAVIDIKSKLKDITKEINKLTDEQDSKTDSINEQYKKLNEANYELRACFRPTEIEDYCPYIPEIKCNTLISHKKEMAKAYKQAKEKFDKEQEIYDSMIQEITELQDKQRELDKNIIPLNNELNFLQSEFERYCTIKKDYEEYLESHNIKTFDSETENELKNKVNTLRAEITNLTNIKVKLVANEKYKEVLNNNQKELATWENNLVILEKLKDYTGPNKLQSELAEKPFIDLSKEITTYLKKMFHNDDIKCWFNLSSKSNSFDFGIIRDGINIPFTVLSSGEQCMYMLALQSALMISNKQEFNTILIDDAFDHLDEDNIITLVEAVLNTDIQYIIAGVANIPETDELKDLNKIKIGG